MCLYNSDQKYRMNKFQMLIKTLCVLLNRILGCLHLRYFHSGQRNLCHMFIARQGFTCIGWSPLLCYLSLAC